MTDCNLYLEILHSCVFRSIQKQHNVRFVVVAVVSENLEEKDKTHYTQKTHLYV